MGSSGEKFVLFWLSTSCGELYLGSVGRTGLCWLETGTAKIQPEVARHGALQWGRKRDNRDPVSVTAGLTNYI